MSKFNLSESEKNRILGLHKTKKENVILQEQINYRGKGYSFPVVPNWAMENPCFSVLENPGGGFNIYCRREPNMGEPIDGRTGVATAVYLGISPSECCPSLTEKGSGKRNQVLKEQSEEIKEIAQSSEYNNIARKLREIKAEKENIKNFLKNSGIISPPLIV